jgi:hypothetical protein
METLGRASSGQVRRMFEDFCAAGLTPDEALAALRNDGFSSSDLAGLYTKPAARRGLPGPSREGAARRNSRELGVGDRIGDRALEGRPARNIPAALRKFGISEVWTCANEYPWRTLALIALAAASLAALTIYKSARGIVRFASRRLR